MDRTTEHDDERRLGEIEQELATADPALAAALSTVSPVWRPVWPWMALAVGANVVVGDDIEVLQGVGAILRHRP